MLSWTQGRCARGAAGIAAAVALSLALAAPVAAGELYSWTTEDGSRAFTDDPKKIPARYRERARTRPVEQLSDYERYTAKDPEATSRYEAALAVRLEGLRRLNAALERGAAQAAAPASDPDLSLRLGGAYAPELDLAGRDGAEHPVVVERIRVRSPGEMATRHDTVVRQGDRTLLVVRGRQHAENNAALAIDDELGSGR